MKKEFNLLQQCSVDIEAATVESSNDQCLKQWANGRGPYTTNGVVAGIIHKSSVAENDPDLYIFGIPGEFYGYYPGYFARFKDKFTWAILKGHTRNKAGYVHISSNDPFQQANINFNYFAGGGAEDLQAMVDGVKFVRSINGGLFASKVIDQETVPSASISSDNDIRNWVNNEAWGHHACCTNKMGAANDASAVIDSSFRVRGVNNLRVVDASSFPVIPGFFIVLPLYMLSEKAADVIIQQAKAATGSSRRLIPSAAANVVNRARSLLPKRN
jgi:choline dehydrogenase